jgi:hypothetical protein
LGVAAAVVAGIAAFLLYAVESRRDRLAEEDRRLAAEDRRLAAEDRRRAEEDRLAQIEDAHRAQADKVAAWYGSYDQRPGAPAMAVLPVYGALIRNASDLPIYDVRVIFYFVHHLQTGSSEWEPIERGRASEDLRVIPPDQTEFMRIPDGILWQVDNLDQGRDNFVVGIEFRDAAGNRWKRDARGGSRSCRPGRRGPVYVVPLRFGRI